ncbi:hypothetical protein HEP87_56165 [Streptomyces sp. S1D4-11]|nr:hypothetical protein [Streptomyces sp. S1D4-11]QIY92942.1 hypothetical protein HEP87_56165 [Streptomyces sp. S1D4-11]
MAERRPIYNQVTELTNRIKNGEPRMTASRGPGRGSAGGSIVASALGTIDLTPDS